MKVYVDSKDIELTKDLFEIANVYDWYNCNLDDELELVSLTDYTKQVRKEVYEEFKEKIEKRNNGIRHSNHSEQYKDGYSGCCCELEEILDQIGETK